MGSGKWIIPGAIQLPGFVAEAAGECQLKKTTKALEGAGRDFPGDAKGKAVPYGSYDVQSNEGYMVVGVSHATAIQRWWLEVGQVRYPGCQHILLQADSGGVNASDSWLWEAALQTLADRYGITITVTHHPAGASKWNLIEHRMFCIIRQNWAG